MLGRAQLKHLISSHLINATRSSIRHYSTQRLPRWKTYGLTAVGERCNCESKTDDGFTIRSDTPKSAGGLGGGAQPVQLLLSSLVGCEQATAHFLARKLRMKLEKIEFNIEAQRDEWGSMARPVDAEAGAVSRLQRIWGSAFVHGDMSDEQVAQLAALVHVRCPVANMVTASGCELEIVWRKARKA